MTLINLRIFYYRRYQSLKKYPFQALQSVPDFRLNNLATSIFIIFLIAVFLALYFTMKFVLGSSQKRNP